MNSGVCMSTHEDQVRAFAHYNRAFNAQLLATLSTLDEALRTRDVGAFFGSIHGTLNHILLADRIWLARFASAYPHLVSLQGAALVTEFASLGQELCADFDALRSARAETDDVISRWADEVDAGLLASTMRYRTSNGTLREHPAWVAVAHLFNHQTHHRGQVTTLMVQLGVDPGVTDFPMFVL